MNIYNYFENALDKYGEKTALVVDGSSYSYREIGQKAALLSRVLRDIKEQNIGVFASRSLSDYTGILSILAGGRTYVSLNIKFPAARNLLILKNAGIKTLIMGDRALAQIEEMQDDLSPETVLICPETDGKAISDDLRNKFKIYDSSYFSSVPAVHSDLEVKSVKKEDIAYIVFTSGSTGVPKGVPVSHGNVKSLIDYLLQQYEIGPEDRFSQFSDLTFDLSVQDIFLSWAVGASLHIVPEAVLFGPAKFINDQKLTVWYSAPSVIHLLKRFRMLKPDGFPTLRYSLFCGEALSQTLAEDWQKAAPDSIVENIYGPAEATVGISHYRLPKNADEVKGRNGIVSIGKIFDTQEFCLVDDADQKTEKMGELCVAGSQVFEGYWQDSQKTAERFVEFEDDPRKWYRTGDVVIYEDGNLYFVSRKDFMVKIRGNYVELEEVNQAVQGFTSCEKAYTVPHPVIDGIATDLYCFLDADEKKHNKNDILAFLKKKFPYFMVPKDIFYIKEFPLNNNGKVDRKQLIQKLK